MRHGEPRRGGDLDHALSELDKKHVRDFLRERPVSYVDELCEELFFSRSLLLLLLLLRIVTIKLLLFLLFSVFYLLLMFID